MKKEIRNKKKEKNKLSLVTCHLSLVDAGFTLMEILIVIAILSVLASVIGANLFGSLSKGRDGRRKQDLSQVAKALELYYNDIGAYPSPPLPAWGTAFSHPTESDVVYIQKLPTDPSPNLSYCYTSDTNGSYYKLYANLENNADPQLLPTPVPCNSVNYNYGISSPNTTP